MSLLPYHHDYFLKRCLATEKDKLGIIWGCTVQPLSPELSVSVPYEGSALATQIARCKKCYTYINPFVTLRDDSWVCNHCVNCK